MPRTPWQNSLGMKFQPVSDLRFSIWETRVQDYAPFATETKRTPGIIDENKDGQSDIGQTETHPVVNINRADAIAFCQWLTARERRDSYLPDNLEYRLPTDTEWSLAAGNILDEGLPNPASRHNRLIGIYPWDPEDQYPPMSASPEGTPPAANLGDITAVEKKMVRDLPPKEMEELKSFGYNDGFAGTAPVGSFRRSKANELFDLSGNVWEFVSDDYGINTKTKTDPKMAKFAVTRGASWAEPVTLNKQVFYTQYRRPLAPDKEADSRTGFRVVLAPVKPAP
jgi:formylglycine-generating enzyme required for sulfatase activity